MADKLSLDKTTISIGFLVVLAPAIFVGISSWASIQSRTDRNTEDIAAIFKKLDTLNANLVETNGNIIRLNTRLDGLTSERTSITVPPAPQSTGSVVVVGSEEMQPSEPQENDLQPADPPQEPEAPKTPEEQEEEPTIVARLQQAVGNLFEVVLR